MKYFNKRLFREFKWTASYLFENLQALKCGPGKSASQKQDTKGQHISSAFINLQQNFIL